MSKIKVAINGFGRIGRITFRNLEQLDNVEVVAINDLTDTATLAHLFKYDSVHGRFNGSVQAEGDNLIINGKKIRVYAERNPADLPWAKHEVDVVAECTGIFRNREAMNKHLSAGAKKVALSVPADKADDVDLTIVLGVNCHLLKPEHKLISNASCTTNCLAPIAKVLNDNFGIVSGLMNTIHAYTNDQVLLDSPHKDLRRGRNAATSIIPTKTGAAKAVSLVIPELKGKLDGYAMRVPTHDGSVVDLACILSKNTNEEEVNAAMKAAAEGPMKGILEYCTDPIVSVDIIGNPYSSIYDVQLTKVINGNFVKVVSWYDNEAGYSARMADLICKLGS